MTFMPGALAVFAMAAALTALPYLAGADSWLAVIKVTSSLGYLALALGAVRGAMTFDRGDVLRRAWLWISAGGVLGFVSCLISGPPLRALAEDLRNTPGGEAIGVATDIGLNVTMVMGLVMFTRAWSQTGLVPPWQRPAALLAFTVGVAVAGPSLWHDTHAALAGSGPAIGSTISDLGDIASMTLVGPLLASAVWMRGGALVGPYIYLTGCAIAWLMFDAGSLIFAGHYSNGYDMFFSVLGNLFGGLAGLTHYWVIRSRSRAIDSPRGGAKNSA